MVVFVNEWRDNYYYYYYYRITVVIIQNSALIAYLGQAFD